MLVVIAVKVTVAVVAEEECVTYSSLGVMVADWEGHHVLVRQGRCPTRSMMSKQAWALSTLTVSLTALLATNPWDHVKGCFKLSLFGYIFLPLLVLCLRQRQQHPGDVDRNVTGVKPTMHAVPHYLVITTEMADLVYYNK